MSVTGNLVKSRTIEIPISMENFEEAHSFIGKRLKKNHISKEIIAETMLVFEALFHNLIEQGFNQDTLLTIKTQRTFGEINIKFGFEGKPFVQIGEDPNNLSPEDRILQAFNDKIDYSYRAGYNNIRISVKRTRQNSLLFCGIGILLAILIYLPVSQSVSADHQLMLEQNFVFPLLKLFANAMMMVGAPVTFFSLLKNLTDTYIVAERNFVGRKLQAKMIITSVISVFLAVAVSFLVVLLISHRGGYLAGFGSLKDAPSFSELIVSLVPDNIFQPFETFMPFPLIFVALIITYAFCSVGKYFDRMKKATDACYTLFSKMLNVVMFTLPFFCFLAVFNTLLGNGFREILVILEIVAAVVVGLIFMALFYLVRLLIGGVKIGELLKHLGPLLRENFIIGSAIDAVPFNIRYCARNYGMDRKRISDQLPVLAQINLDGNCYLIMLTALLVIFMMDNSASLYNIIVIAVVVVFLSFGAPNQPGSMLIGMLIITMYLHADSLISVAILSEVFFGSLQNLINVTGDIVTVAIEEQKIKTAP